MRGLGDRGRDEGKGRGTTGAMKRESGREEIQRGQRASLDDPLGLAQSA